MVYHKMDIRSVGISIQIYHWKKQICFNLSQIYVRVFNVSFVIGSIGLCICMSAIIKSIFKNFGVCLVGIKNKI